LLSVPTVKFSRKIPPAAIVSSTIGICLNLGVSVISECIVYRATTYLLTIMGCEEGQGYYFARPLPVAELERQFLATETSSTMMLADGQAA
jgi:EAL domain-containing protein (putative c-di-GMP-specific phosphodiesterase class I)